MTARVDVAVAISTTGDPHRLGFLETCVRNWNAALPANSSLFVTVDGDKVDAITVARVVAPWTSSVFRVGGRDGSYAPRRHGVATNKNTGLELMMENTAARHLFLSDDDASPLNDAALRIHMDMATLSVARDQTIPHSMLGWGRHRLQTAQGHAPHMYATWSWPRGVMLYATRDVVETVGGMIEEFGPGGHEHVEWSRRIHQAGLTPQQFCTPAVYAMNNARGAYAFWHCEDMPGPGEPLGNFRVRKQRNTSIRRPTGSWEKIEAVMAARDGNTDFVPFTSQGNGRASATLVKA